MMKMSLTVSYFKSATEDYTAAELRRSIITKHSGFAYLIQSKGNQAHSSLSKTSTVMKTPVTDLLI